LRGLEVAFFHDAKNLSGRIVLAALDIFNKVKLLPCFFPIALQVVIETFLEGSVEGLYKRFR